ncbi:hypothetical protein GCM10007938_01420 [Vibrio zhanjiangensis]|uniref:Uncharacterized protein n=1 Tax=Vibrio zhanjiangensis TaxID=1046128 RepID=A0ABQ6EUJ0_9VIBR|nr:hypothetical protein [Vibrio zhanjiangensis]GLT16366.1 hypothetical protein GCM10007938_01420 [Vibrio zhanjiangensis]
MKRRFWGILTTKAQPFSKWWQEFRAEVAVIPMEDPLDPIVFVDDRVLTVRTGYHNRRNAILVPLMMVYSFFSILALNDLLPDFESKQEFAHEMLEYVEQQRALANPSYRTDDIERRYKALLDENGEVTWSTYLRAKELEGQLESLMDDFLFLCFFLLPNISMWVIFFLKPRDAEVYFDRQRKIVYSWRHGRVGAAYFDKMGLIENQVGINLVLQFENKKQKGYHPMAIVGIDTGKLTFHTEADTTYPLAQILAFMDHGKSAVITGPSFKRKPAKFFWRVDPKPDNFEQRVNAALEAEGDFVHQYQTRWVKGHAI